MPVAADMGSGASFGVTAVTCAVAAAVAVVMLLRTARSRPEAPRAAYLVLAAAVATGPATLGTVAVVRALTGPAGPAGPGPADHVHAGPAHPEAALSPVDLREALAAGVGFTVASLLLGVGLLMLPCVVVRRARLARVLDGLLVACCGFLVVWALFLEPWHVRHLGTEVPFAVRAACLALAVPTLAGAAVLGTILVSAVHVARLRNAALAGCVGAGIACVAGVVLVYPAAGRAEPLLPAAGLALCAGYLMTAYAARRAERASAPATPHDAHGGGSVSIAAVVVAFLACVTRLLLGWRVDPAWRLDDISIYTAVTIGGLLAVQQSLARRDIRRYAERLAQSEAHFRVMAHTDALTSLANRRELLRTLEHEARGGPPCVLLAIDLDGFKNINDIRGHDVGDAVLIEVARRLRSNVRPKDCAARLGGDEFAVLMWARPAEAHSVAERILGVLSGPYELETGTVFVTASVGLAGCATADSVASLLRNADLALRFAKLNGKNRVEAYDAAYDELVRRRTDLEHELRGAVERGELMLVYQPIVALPDAGVAGVEALLRWHHPRLGSVPPAEFVPLAEDLGLIHGLGEFVMHEACHQLSRWRSDGHDLWMSINASVRELHSFEYARRIAEVLRRHRVPTDRLVVEVTERAVAQDVARLAERLAALRDTGVRVALDDFGSEYSSLKLLRTLPVDILKLDHQLLDTEGEAGSTALIDLVVGLGRRLGQDVVAEGVTTPAQRGLLEACGCAYAQGDLFGGPLPAERVEALFRPAIPEQIPAQAGDVDQNVGAVDSGREIRQS